MGYKFSPRLVGLTRGVPRPGARHRVDGRRVCEANGNERYFRSLMLDRTKSKYNEYQGFCSGSACWDDMENRAEQYRVKGKTKNGKEVERRLRYDAVIGYSVLLRPPLAMTIDWMPEDYKKLYRDSFCVLEVIESRLFRPENIRMAAIHRDEGLMDENGKLDEHLHIVGEALDQEGHYCGNLLDAALLSRISQNFPRLMRERGWQLEDLDTTDYYRMGWDKDGKPRDAAYRAERIAKWRQAKLSSAAYNAKKAKETEDMYQEALDHLKAAKEVLKAAEAKEQELAEKEQEMVRLIEAGRRALANEISGDAAADKQSDEQ